MEARGIASTVVRTAKAARVRAAALSRRERREKRLQKEDSPARDRVRRSLGRLWRCGCDANSNQEQLLIRVAVERHVRIETARRIPGGKPCIVVTVEEIAIGFVRPRLW